MISHDITEHQLITADKSCIRSGCLVECWRALVNLRSPADLLHDLAPDVSPIYKILFPAAGSDPG